MNHHPRGGTEIPAMRKRRDTGMLATPFMAGHCLLGQHKTKVMGICLLYNSRFKCHIDSCFHSKV